MKEKTTEIISCCNDCGSKKYNVKRNVGVITMHMGICPFCKKEKPIIPTSDWEYMCGNTEELD